MKKFFMLMGALAIIIIFSVEESHAQDVKPVMSKDQVVNLVARVYQSPAKKFLSKSLNGPDNRGFRVVFIHNGKRYTLDHNWWTDGVQVWVRPNGTSHPSPPANAFADKNTDGIVDFGTDGHNKIFAVANTYYEGSEAKGLEHRPYWQNIYDEALSGLRTTLH